MGKLSSIATGGPRPGKVAAPLQPGRHGGALSKAVDTGAHKPQRKTPVATDRGAFTIKG